MQTPVLGCFTVNCFVFSGARKQTQLKDFTLDSDVLSVDGTGQDVDESAGEEEDVEESVDKEEAPAKAARSKHAQLTLVV